MLRPVVKVVSGKPLAEQFVVRRAQAACEGGRKPLRGVVRDASVAVTRLQASGAVTRHAQASCEEEVAEDENRLAGGVVQM